MADKFVILLRDGAIYSQNGKVYTSIDECLAVINSFNLRPTETCQIARVRPVRNVTSQLTVETVND